MRRAVVMILDGLRRDCITQALTPRLAAFARDAERFDAHRSVFPSATRVVASSMATGCYPARHGLQGNSAVLLVNGVPTEFDAGLPDFLQQRRAITGSSLAMPTLAQRLAPHGGAIIFANVSPGAAYAHDPDGFGHVYNRAGSFAPGRLPAPDPLNVTLGLEGDRAMTTRFVAEALPRRPALALIWTAEPDHMQHELTLGSPEHNAVLRCADAHAGMVIDAVARLRDAGEDILLILASDHGHETVTGVIDIEAELIAAGLKAAPDSTDVIACANGVSSLIYLHPDHRDRLPALGGFLRSRDWAQAVFDATTLPAVGQSAAAGLAFAVALRTSTEANACGMPGLALAAKARAGKSDHLGFGQHGGLGAYEQSPFLMVSGPGFTAGAARTTQTSALDIAPTILAHLKIAASALDGTALQRG